MPIDLDYRADGLTMRGRLFVPQDATGPRPGVLIFPDIMGIGDHVYERGERLAALGYVALACDLHGDGRRVEDLDGARAAAGHLRETPRALRPRTEPAFAALAARPEVDAARIAAIGYCFGGTMALELARGGSDVKAVVGFHSGLGTATPEDARNIGGKVLVCIGADDPGVPPEQRADFEQEMRAAGVDWQLHLYGGVVHSFTNKSAADMNMPDFARYDAQADARSWAAMIGLFDEVLAG